MKCTLVHLPVWQALTPPLSLAYLKGSLLKHDIECKTIDFALRANRVSPHPGGDASAENEILDNGPLLEQWKEEILSTSPDFVGFSVLMSNMKLSHKMADMIREAAPGLPIISGGPVFTPEQMPRIKEALEFSDCVVQGEGETVLPQLAEVIRTSGDFRSVKQVWTRDAGGNSVFSGSMPLVHLDDLPFPNFDDFDLEKYPEKRRLSMMFSRGCILNCSFCTNKWNDKTQRSRTAKNVYAELIHNIERYRINRYIFNDDSLLSYITIPAIEEFCDLTIANGTILPWAIFGTRIDRLLNPPFVKKLAKSGLNRVMFGVESFSSVVQKHMGKSSNYELADKVIRMFTDEGITAWSYLIYGYVNESDTDFEVTFKWLEKNGGLLSNLWIHPFFVNDRYLKLRPGTVTQYGRESWAWFSEHSTLEIKKVRFLRLVKLLEEIRVKHPTFTYGIADPYGTKYFSKWDDSVYESMRPNWEKLDKHRHDKMRKWFRTGQIQPLGGPLPI